jgi:hypothetical protein
VLGLMEDRVLAVALVEYQDIRDEIHQRVNHQITIAGANVALGAAVLTFSSHFANLPDALPFGLVFPFGVIGWLYFEQDVFITQAAAYAHAVLRPLITTRANEGSTEPVPLLEWEDFRNRRLFERRRDRRWLWMMIAFRYTATVGPGVALWIWGIERLVAKPYQHGLAAWLLYGLLAAAGAGMLLSLGSVASSVFGRYNEITARNE